MSVGTFELEEDPDQLAAGRRTVGDAAATLGTGQRRVLDGVRRAGERWTGARSEVFDTAAHGVTALLARAATASAEVGAVLGALGSTVRHAEDELGHLQRQDEALAAVPGLPVQPAEGLLADTRRRRAALADHAAEIKRDLLRRERRAAQQIDAVTDRLAPQLSTLSPADAVHRVAGTTAPSGHGLEAVLARLGGALLVGPDGALHLPPGSGATPTQVHTWWTGLAPAQRSALLRTRPGELGNLDGIPVLDRDTANRIVLPRELAALRAQLTELGEEPAEHLPGVHLPDTNPAWDRWKVRRDDLLGRINGSRAILSAIEGRTDPRAYLLGYQPRVGRGRAVVAYGDPDTSAHTVVYVPGTMARLSTIGEGVRRARTIHAVVGGSAPSGAVAAVAWYGYDAPPTLADAASLRYADRGAPLLDRFARGLAATSRAPQQHLTVAAHSYGTTLVGRSASHGHRLLADDVFLLASPGMGVGSGWAGHGVLRGTVDDLRLRGASRGHVFASTARDDPIRFVRGTLLGEDPVDPASGVIAVGATPTGRHDSYFVAGNPALRGLGQVGAGHRDRVRRASRSDNASAFDDERGSTWPGPLLPGWPTP